MVPDDIEGKIQELRRREPGAVKAMVDAFTQPLMAGALGMGFTVTDAEELVQDTFVTFLKAADRFEGRSKLKTYLFGILYNKGREMRRKNQREEASEDVEAVFDQRFNTWGIWNCFPKGPEEEALSRELLALFKQCSEALSLDQRTAFHLKEVEGQSTEAICNILGVSGTHLGVLLFRARNKLRECLERKWGRR